MRSALQVCSVSTIEVLGSHFGNTRVEEVAEFLLFFEGPRILLGPKQPLGIWAKEDSRYVNLVQCHIPCVK